ncbi:uncharacterized protein LAJ45_08961 [Morchella importuna]|uniref:uncharacterized protein n=1 Tax=Morchella importuna TaxID=1174673 RepID=UPI001E8D00BC|nr:uncharacterized protein LAJ45_08961 [Morchella importuna]KAH8146882.1 hypothetical protein LAJ45_08961 [Morchella importuna]
MSILNLIASLSASSYPAMYTVHYRGLCNPSNMDKTVASGGGGGPSGDITATVASVDEVLDLDGLTIDAAIRREEENDEGERDISPRMVGQGAASSSREHGGRRGRMRLRRPVQGIEIKSARNNQINTEPITKSQETCCGSKIRQHRRALRRHRRVDKVEKRGRAQLCSGC